MFVLTFYFKLINFVSNIFFPKSYASFMPPMLSGSLVTTAWRDLRLRMEEKASRYGGQLRIYWISSRGQPTRGGPPAWGLGGGVTTPHRKKKKHVTKCHRGPRNWTDTLERPKAKKMDMRFGTWNVRSLYRPGSLKPVSGESAKYKKIAVFWVVAPCSLVEVYQRFRGPCCLHHQGDE
jgi:hypothetical protein